MVPSMFMPIISHSFAPNGYNHPGIYSPETQLAMKNHSRKHKHCMANGKRPLIAEDLNELKKVVDVHLSPDGQSVVYATEHIDHKTETKFTDMWVAPIQDGQPRQITQENQSNNQLRWLNKYAK